LQPHRGRASDPAAASDPDRYRYDPANPTPSLGGPTLFQRRPVVDNRPLERRDDVLTYTTAPLEDSVEAIGPVTAEIYARSSVQHFDVFVRVCDVDRSGVSRNVCDALMPVTPQSCDRRADGTVRVVFPLWPTAHRFSAGHRIRVQVSSGAHPRYARNSGTGEPLATATRLVAADQEVFHDPKHPSAVTLSVIRAACSRRS
jgi:putative CocE/NonD family hydrolase